MSPIIRQAGSATLNLVREIREDNLQQRTLAAAVVEVVRAIDQVPAIFGVRTNAIY